jgi:hypothetical protein
MTYHLLASLNDIAININIRSGEYWYVINIAGRGIYREPGISNPVPFPIDESGKIMETK